MTREEAIKTIRLTCPKISDSECDFETAMRFLIPELCESEDERIIEEIKFAVMQMPSERQDTKNRCLAWLEKQKEEKGYEAIPVESTLEYKLGFKAGKESEKQKPIKWTDLTWKDIDKLEGIINNVHYEFRNGIGQESFGKEVLEKFREYKGDEYLDEIEQKPLSTEETELNSLAFLSQMGYTCIPPKKEHQNNSDAPKNALGGALNSPLDKDKNLDDIAQDYVEAVKEYNPEPTWDLMQTAVCYGYHYREGEEQKPAEWSEEDRKMIDHLIESLPMWANGRIAMLPSQADEYVERLKFLCPQPKQEWSEEEYGRLFDIEHYLDGTLQLNPDRKIACIDFLKSLRPQPHWKPTKNQLDALNLVIMDYTEDGCVATANYLQEISAEIKKL